MMTIDQKKNLKEFACVSTFCSFDQIMSSPIQTFVVLANFCHLRSLAPVTTSGM